MSWTERHNLKQLTGQSSSSSCHLLPSAVPFNADATDVSFLAILVCSLCVLLSVLLRQGLPQACSENYTVIDIIMHGGDESSRVSGAAVSKPHPAGSFPRRSLRVTMTLCFPLSYRRLQEAGQSCTSESHEEITPLNGSTPAPRVWATQT